MGVTTVDVTDQEGNVVRDDLLARAESVHRELRPHIPANYVEKMRRIFADGGRLTVAFDGNDLVGVALWRIYEDTFNGRKIYCDDLVTTANRRSKGIGGVLIAHMADIGRHSGCDNLVLDSGTARHEAHRFYFREGFVITSFNFKKPLK